MVMMPKVNRVVSRRLGMVAAQFCKIILLIAETICNLFFQKMLAMAWGQKSLQKISTEWVLLAKCQPRGIINLAKE